MKEEYVKNRTTTKISIIIICILAVICSLVFLVTYVGVIFKDTGSIDVYGIKGIFQRKANLTERVKGPVTTDELNDIVNIYHKESDDKAYLRANADYPEMSFVLESAYSDPGQQYDFEISEIDNANDFYNQHSRHNYKALEAGKKYQLTKNEIAYVESKNDKGPYYMDFTDHFILYKNSYMIMTLIMALAAIIITSKEFCMEKATELDKVIAPLGTGTKKLIAVKKIVFCLGLVSVLYLIVMLILYMVLLLPFGRTGWRASLQVFFMYYGSLYKWNMTDFYFHTLISGWIVILGVSVVTAIIASLSGNAKMSIVISVALFYIPLLFGKMIPSKLLMHIVELDPLMDLNPDEFVTSFYSYGIGGYRLTSYYMTVLLTVIISAVGIPYVINRFPKSMKAR